jgi:general secretion pathway protein H
MTSRSEIGPAMGFTLIEMIVVIALLGLMMVLVTVNGTPVSPAAHARAAAEAISGALRTARSEAVTGDRSVDVTIDISQRSYRWGTAPAEILPNDLSLALLTSRDELISDAVGHIRFNPDGSSSGGRVTVAGGNRIWWVGIDWLSGRVSIVEKPR